MSTSNYDMATVWNDFSAPQLEQEYSQDPTMYGGLPGDGATSPTYTQRRTAAPHGSAHSLNASLSSFDPTFQQSVPGFTFSAPHAHTQQSPNMSNRMSFLILQQGSPQAHGQFTSSNPLYHSPSTSPHHDPVPLASNVVGYNQYQQQVPGMRSGPGSAGSFNQAHNDGYGGQNIAYNSGFSQGQMQLNTSPGMQQHGLYGSSIGAQQGSFDGPAFKRPRPQGDESGFDDDADAEGTSANKGEPVKPKACVCPVHDSDYQPS